MNEEPKSIWTKSWKGSTGPFLWFLLLAGAGFLVVFAIGSACGISPAKDLATIALVGTFGLALVSVLAFLFIRWLCCWRNLRRFLFGLACLATLVALFYAEEDLRGKYAWEKFKRQWEAKGERFDLVSVIPPPVPDDQNFATAPIVASTYAGILDKNGHRIAPPDTNVSDRLKMSVEYKNGGPTNGTGNWQKVRESNLKAWQDYYRALAVKTNLFPVALQPQSRAADVLLALSKYDSTIEELRQASQRPYSRFPLDYDEYPAAILLPYLAAVRHCSQVLQLRAIAELQSGQSDKALEDVKLMLRLTDSIRTEPFLISHLVRIAVLNVTLQPIWEGLAEYRWSDAQLVELDQELAGLDFLADYKLAMRGELVLCQIGNIEYLRSHRRELPFLFGEGDTAPWDIDPFILRLIPSGWFYQNQLSCARFTVQHYLPLADLEDRIISPASALRANEVIMRTSAIPHPTIGLNAYCFPRLAAL